MGGPKEPSTFVTNPCSRQTSASTYHSPVPFGFESKTSFNATQNLLKTRSESFKHKQKTKVEDIWNKSPPDFRMQLYHPKPPKIQSRESNPRIIPGVKNWPLKRDIIPPRLQFTSNKPDGDMPEFLTSFTPLDPHGARVLFTTSGMHSPGPYTMPKPHDHRGLIPIKKLGLDEFLTNSDHDPYNLQFKTQRLDIVHGLPTTAQEVKLAGDVMAPTISSQPKWLKELIHPKEKFPNKYHAYTRFRPLVRSPESAYMERVEKKVAQDWGLARDETTF